MVAASGVEDFCLGFYSPGVDLGMASAEGLMVAMSDQLHTTSDQLCSKIATQIRIRCAQDHFQPHILDQSMAGFSQDSTNNAPVAIW